MSRGPSLAGAGSPDGPLVGVRVIDCSTQEAGIRATALLADHGADVVRIVTGEGSTGDVAAIANAVFNRGKRIVQLDPDDPDGLRELVDLIGTADLLVETWAPGVAQARGLDFASLHQRFPELVHCSITGFGEDGPHSHLPAHEALVHAVAGSMGEQAGMREGPIYQGLPFASIGAACLAVIGGLAALYRVGEDHVGRRVETSLLDGALAYLAMLWGDTEIDPPVRDPGSSRLVAKTVLCGDGEYLGVHTGAVGGFGRLMTVLGLDDRIAVAESGRDVGTPLTPEQRRILDVDLHEVFATAPRAEWVERLTAVDVCAIPVLQPAEVFSEPQVVHNGAVLTVQDPDLGPVQQVAPTLRFSGAAPAAPEPARGVAACQAPAVAPLVERSAGRDAVPDLAATERPLLEGLRILDLGSFYAGPYASRLLADLGAEVIKLEALRGDTLRGLPVSFRSAQAGKRSIVLDLKEPEGRAVARRLIEAADIVHHNMRPGAAERLEVGFEDCRALNPEVVYLHSPGWGSTGPWRDRQSFAPMLSGYVGAEHEVAGQFNPPLWNLGNEDPGAGLLGACGMLMALVERQRTGRGQYIELPQINAALAHMAHVVRRPDGEVLGALRLDPAQLGFGPLDRLYETADGWMCLVALSDREVDALGGTLGVDLVADARFATSRDREENADDLARLLADAIGGWRTADLVAKLREVGVGAVEPVPYNCRTFLREPENQRSGRVAECLHPRYGAVRELARLVRVSGAAPAEHRLAPELGEHTTEILTELGYSLSDIARLHAEGTAATFS